MVHIPIEPNREYGPKEIFKHGLILNTFGKKDYRYILRLIHAGKLKARNIATGNKYMHFKVLGSDIIKWKKSTVNIQEQPEVYEKPPQKHRYFPQPPEN